MAAEAQVELDRLAVLFQQKLITEEEFNAAKARLMAPSSNEPAVRVDLPQMAAEVQVELDRLAVGPMAHSVRARSS
jgi:hypothetical protein